MGHKKIPLASLGGIEGHKKTHTVGAENAFFRRGC